MRLRRNIMSILLLLFLAVGSAFAARNGSIYGTVRDASHHPLAHASVTLGGTEAVQVTSDEVGQYRFTGLAPVEYRLSASLDGYTASEPRIVRLAQGSTSLSADILLQAVSTGAPPEFQSSGIRGLIDPGGYSASTASAASDVLRNMADVKRGDGDPADAAPREWPCDLEATLRSEVKKEPGDFEANLRLGLFYLAHDEPAKAIPRLMRAYALRSDDFVAARELAQAWLRNHDFAMADDLLKKLSGEHDTSEVHRLLAQAEEGLGHFRQAAREYRTADAAAPSEQDLFGAGYELILAGSLADAETTFAEAVARQPQIVAPRIGLAAAQLLQGRNAEAVENLLAAAAVDREDPRTYPFLASASESSTGRAEQVRKAFQRFAELKPQSALANYFYALALSREGSPADIVEIETLLKRAIELDPHLAGAHLQLAESYARRNDYADAVPQYEAAVNLTRNPGASRYRLALAYERVGRREDAARELKVFRLEREPKTHSIGVGEALDLAQFISVKGDSDTRSSSERRCPLSSR